MEETRREQMIALLTTGPWTRDSLARYFGVPFSVVEDDLAHIEKSTKATHRMKISAAECGACGFVFRNRAKVQKPSRCPECKKERILEGTIFLQAKE